MTVTFVKSPIFYSRYHLLEEGINKNREEKKQYFYFYYSSEKKNTKYYLQYYSFYKVIKYTNKLTNESTKIVCMIVSK